MWIATALTGMEEDTQIPNRALGLFLRTTEERRIQLLQVARRMTNGSEDAEDILQDAFLKAYIGVAEFPRRFPDVDLADRDCAKHGARIPQGTARAAFISIEFLSKEENETVEMDFPDTRLNPEESCRRRELEELVRAEVGKLSLGCRRVIERCVFGEKSQIDAAAALQISVATVKARVSFAPSAR